MPRLCELYPGIYLTTEEKARKNLSQGIIIIIIIIIIGYYGLGKGSGLTFSRDVMRICSLAMLKTVCV